MRWRHERCERESRARAVLPARCPCSRLVLPLGDEGGATVIRVVAIKCRCLYPVETSATTLRGCVRCGKPVLPNLYYAPRGKG